MSVVVGGGGHGGGDGGGVNRGPGRLPDRGRDRYRGEETSGCGADEEKNQKTSDQMSICRR